MIWPQQIIFCNKKRRFENRLNIFRTQTADKIMFLSGSDLFFEILMRLIDDIRDEFVKLFVRRV